MIAPLSLKGYASHFKCDPHDPLGLRIGIVAINGHGALLTGGSTTGLSATGA
jgi:hypothetical protein